MDLKQLKYITVIAEELNLTKASERLFVSQSTLSLFLNRLENSLGVRLFDRHKNRLVITPSGQLYVETAKKMLELQKELYIKLKINQKVKSLNIGISSWFMQKIFAEIFPKFQVLAPDFQINVAEGRAATLLNKLKERELDSIIIGRKSLIEDEHYQIEILKKEEMLFVLPPSHPHAQIASSNYNDPPAADMSLLFNESFALAPHDTSDYQIAAQLLSDYHMNAHIICELNNTHSLCQMVMNGICLSILPSYCVPRDMGLLVCRPPHPYYRYLLYLQRREHKPSKEESTFLTMLFNTYKHYYDSI